ncbi:MAG: HlyD family type I secretion periplasmic adaptor subunit [Aeromonas sp.]
MSNAPLQAVPTTPPHALVKHDELTTAFAAVPTNPWPSLYAGLSLLAAALGGFLLWASLAPLDAGVVADGTVTLSSNRKSIQHLTGGRIKAIYVQEGQVIKQHQPLLALDNTQLTARYSSLVAQFIQSKSTADRLQAEQSNQAAIKFDQRLDKRFAHNPRLAEVRAAQVNLFATRRLAYQSSLALTQENIAGLNKQINDISNIIKHHTHQLALVSTELRSAKSLSDQNFYPKVQLLKLEQQQAELSGTLSEDALNLAKLNSALGESKIKLTQISHEYRRDIDDQLASQQKELAQLNDEIEAIAHELNNSAILAPIAGTVLDLNVTTLGGIIQPGEKIMDIAASAQPLQIDAKIPVNAIDKIQPELAVSVLFPALNHAFLPSIPAKVLTVSADRLVDEVTQQPYYLAQVHVTDEGLKLLSVNKIKAGMPANVVIKTGERTFLNYLFKPMLNRLQLAFKEW